jgi:hypothetical protein
MATIEQLQSALVNADKAGDVAAATALATEIRRMKPSSVQAGEAVNSIPRQIGLAARYGVEGIANTAQIATEPLRYLTDRLTGQTGKTLPLGALASRGLDALGLPSPQTADERTVGDATRLLAGGGGLAAAAGAPLQVGRAVLSSGARELPGMAGRAAELLSSSLPQQFGSAIGAGLAGGASREAGGSPLMQGGAALVGGVAAGMVPGAAGYGINAGKNFVNSFRPGQQQVIQQRIDQTINVTLQSQGIDPATITPAMRSALREQVQRAMNTGGDLNPQALSRLADYTRLGMTTTRARLTLDPFDVTQEQNASRLAAATGARDARLPQIAQENNARLLSTIDDMGGARPADPYGQGNAVAGAIRAQDEALNTTVSGLYRQARDTSGRAADLDRAAFANRVNSLLDEAMVGGALPADVQNKINWIASNAKPQGMHGSIPMPFNVDIAEQLKTQIAKLQRNTSDGSARHALGLVRQALDDTPLMPAQQVNPGNLPAVPGTVPPSPAVLGQQSIDAFNQARQAARQRFQWQESSPVIRRALEGANADTFIQQNIISRAAGFDDVAQAARTINANPQAREAVRTAIVQHLKDSVIGKGGTTETGNVSGRGLTAALKDIGDRKLGLFFEPGEVETLKAMARTGSFEVFQPRGSAVNNSNTAAGVGGLLQGLSKYVKPVANKLPFGEVAISKPLDNLTVSVLQRQAQDLTGGLLMPRQRPPFAQGLLLPAAAYSGGLLATAP